MVEPEYIEREAIIADIDAAVENNGMGYVIAQTLKRYVKRVPAADVVAVVRCGECEYFAETGGKDSGKPSGYGQCKHPMGILGVAWADGFCFYGERRGEDE